MIPIRIVFLPGKPERRCPWLGLLRGAVDEGENGRGDGDRRRRAEELPSLHVFVSPHRPHRRRGQAEHCRWNVQMP
ncbi:hypothetical protein ACFVVL_01490 [Kitasatospora sp. NPDC058115]|uniref:hypothetical protein n=1 Tax=Kitasatospora sp. NPDC058115 TaxID=3346347 RepID=UPI0036DE4D9C